MISKFYTNTKIYSKTHQKTTWAIGIGLIALIWGGYHWFGQTAEPTKYVLAKVEKGTVITAVSGSGQVSASNQVDIKAKSGGDITALYVKAGQKVTTSTLVAQLNAKEALKSVRDAVANYASAKISLEKTKQASSALTLTQAENAVVSAKASIEKLKLSQQTELEKANQTKTTSEESLTNAYQDVYNEVADAFLDLPGFLSDTSAVLSSTKIASTEPTLGFSGQSNDSVLVNTVAAEHSSDRSLVDDLIKRTQSQYQGAKISYDASLLKYKNTNRSTDQAVLENLLTQTLETTKQAGDVIKNEINILEVWSEYRTVHKFEIFGAVTNYKTELAADSNSINSHVTALLSIQKTLQSNRDAIINANRDLVSMAQNQPLDLAAAVATLKEKELSLENLKKGADPLDLRSAQLSLQQRANSLNDARETLADYTIRAPFAGTIASVDVKPRATVSSGGAIATVITDQRIAEITLNEVDVAKIAVGQKATLTFDAVEDLQISGIVGEVNAIGTVSQGVVSYGVKILFDTQDERIKPGMSVSTSIITNVKADVVAVPTSAIKTQGTTSYVEVLSDVTADETALSSGVASAVGPERVAVEIGLAGDTTTEIISGLAEGDAIIVRTIVPVTTAKTTTAPSLLGNTGGAARGLTGGSGGNFRAATGR